MSASNGSWSSPRRRSTRASPSVACCWPGARSTCSSSTCPAAGWPPRTSRPASPTGSAGWRRSPDARRRSSSCSNRPVIAGWPATAVAEVDQAPPRARPAVVDPARARHRRASGRRRWSPAIATARRGRRATLRILYAEGGERDACLRRDDLLHDEAPTITGPRHRRTDPPRCDSSISTDRTSPSSSPGHEPPSPSRPARSSWAAGRGIRARSSTRTRKPGRWASGGGCRSGAPIGSSLRRPSSTRTPTRTGRPSRPPSRRSRRSARGSPAAPTRLDAAFGLFEVQVDGLEALWGPEPVLVERLVEALGGLGGGAGEIRAGIAGHPLHARPWPPSWPAPARRSSSRPVARPTFLAPHPSGLLTQDPDVRARLTRFGLRRIGAVAELDRTALVARFGEEGARIHARARGEELEPFRPRRAPERLRLGLPDRTRGRGSRAAPLRPPSARRGADRAARGARAGGRRGRGCTSTWTSRSPGRGRPPSWTSSSASPNRPPTPRRSSASCSPGSSGPRRRPRSPGSPWSWTARLRRPVSSSRCSRRRPPAAPGSSGSSPGLP